MNARTPMLQQYFRAKEEHPGVILAMRVGDFYEFYGEDAEKAAEALEITLTARQDGDTRMPMAGVPFHSVEKYLARLLAKGLKVAICDQLEDPKAAKGLVRRGVTRVLTPGTVMDDSMLRGSANNFLAALCVQDGRIGLATLDPSTGEFVVTELVGDEADERLLQELERIRPSELLVGTSSSGAGFRGQGAGDRGQELGGRGQGEGAGFRGQGASERGQGSEDQGRAAPGTLGLAAQATLGGAVTELAQPSLDRASRRLIDQFQVSNLHGFGLEDRPSAVIAASMILAYAEKNKLPLAHVDSISTYSVDGFMRLDPATRRSLELTSSMSDGTKKHTLLAVLDETVTSMGARLMRRWIEQPLLDAGQIVARHEGVERLLSQSLTRGDLRDGLKRLSDLERLVSRVAAGLAGPRDLAALRDSILAIPALADPLRKVGLGRIQELREQISDHSPVGSLIDSALVADPPHAVRDGGVIRAGFDLELDKLRDLGKNGKSYIASLEQKERETTGIGNLKVGFNSVFGYFLEVGKAQIGKVPEHYIRKQTTANAERYITAELKEHESLVLGAEEKATSLEADLFGRLRLRVAEHAKELLQTARALAEIDVLASLAEVASRYGYVRPEIVSSSDCLSIEAGRHPVVECATTQFVPNGTVLGYWGIGVLEDSSGAQSDQESAGPPLAPPGAGGEPDAASPMEQRLEAGAPRILILTGPNMSGKSTYLRQNALIVLMAQMGSFVPARACRMSLCDRIFARIGAKDELALGQSTFMVEMVESANILNHATGRSLVILDEVGRGTSTYDGLAIAWAMVEHLAAIGAKTLFATHYHQLNSLADQIPGIANFRVAVEEVGDDIVWTHRVLPGGTDRSYGVQVARMAGVPTPVLLRAAAILEDLEQKSDAPRAVPAQTQKLQMTLFEFEEPPMVRALQGLDVDRLTPVEALRMLDDWKRKWGN